MTEELVVTLTRSFERVIVSTCVPLLLYVGYRMFVAGATGRMQLTTEAATWKGKITNVTPGSLCFLLAAVLGVMIMRQEVPVWPEPKDGQASEHPRFSFFGGDQERPSEMMYRTVATYHLRLAVAGTEEQRSALRAEYLTAFGDREPTYVDLTNLEEAERQYAEATMNDDAASSEAAVNRIKHMTSGWSLK